MYYFKKYYVLENCNYALLSLCLAICGKTENSASTLQNLKDKPSNPNISVDR